MIDGANSADCRAYLPADGCDGILTTKVQLIAVTGRTAVAGPEDISTVASIRDAKTITSLSAFLRTKPPADPGPLNFITWDDEAAEGVGIFDYVNMALAWQAPAYAEVPMLGQFGRIGVVAGKRVTTDGMSPEIVSAIEAGVAAAKANAAELLDTSMAVPVGGGWMFKLENIAQFGDNYLLRAAISAETIYPNTPEEAMYGLAWIGENDQTLNGANAYTVTFAGDAPPSIKIGGFWSLTIYDDASTAMVPNALERYSFGDRTPGLVFGNDNALKVCMQVQEPTDPA